MAVLRPGRLGRHREEDGGGVTRAITWTTIGMSTSRGAVWHRKREYGGRKITAGGGELLVLRRSTSSKQHIHSRRTSTLGRATATCSCCGERGNVAAIRNDVMHKHSVEMPVQEKHWHTGEFTTCRGDSKIWRTYRSIRTAPPTTTSRRSSTMLRWGLTTSAAAI